MLFFFAFIKEQDIDSHLDWLDVHEAADHGDSDGQLHGEDAVHLADEAAADLKKKKKKVLSTILKISITTKSSFFK